MTCPLEDKVSTGSAPSPDVTGSLSYPMTQFGVWDNVKEEKKPEMNTGSSSVLGPERCPANKLNSDFQSPDISSYRAAQQLHSMSAKKTPESPIRSSNSEQNHSTVPPPWTGTEYGTMLNQEILCPSPPILGFDITAPSDEYLVTLFAQLRWSEAVQYFGVQLAQVRLVEHGNYTQMLTLRFQTTSGGTVITNRMPSLLMSSVAKSQLKMSFGGWIGIRYWLNIKEGLSPYVLADLLLQVICIPETGIPTPMSSLNKLFLDD